MRDIKDKDYWEMDMALASSEHENRLLRARNERLEKDLSRIKSSVAGALKSLEMLAPDSASIIRQLRLAVEESY